MLQISAIVRKTEKMFDLFNAYFYNMELTRPAITVPRTAVGEACRKLSIENCPIQIYGQQSSGTKHDLTGIEGRILSLKKYHLAHFPEL